MRPLFLILFALAAPFVGAQTPVDAPVIVSVTANGSTFSALRPGWPLLIAADLLHRDAYTATPAPVRVEGGGGSWASALHIEVRDADGHLVAWPLHADLPAEAVLMLDTTAVGRATYWLSPEETAALASGTYTLYATLDSTALGVPALRSPQAVPVSLTIGPDAGDAGALPFLLAEYHGLRGQKAEALAAVDALLASEAGHLTGLAYRGLLLRGDGRTREALDAFEAANVAVAGSSSASTSFLLAETTHAWEHAVDFEVTVQEKGLNHPYAQTGGPLGYAIDGMPGEELMLERGKTYTFRMSGVPEAHPFYFTTDPVGGGANAYTLGVEGTPAWGADVVTFTPDEHTPGVLYYGSTRSTSMGWRLRMDTTTPLAAEPPVAVHSDVPLILHSVRPNPATSEATVSLSLSDAQQVRVEVMDLLGRRVLLLYDGVLASGTRALAFGADALPSGLYVVRVVGERFTGTTPFVVAH